MKLEQLIPQYGQHDQELKDLKKVCDSEKEEIKKIMTEQNSTCESYGGFKVNRVVQKRQSFNEEKAIEILKANNIQNVIKTKEYLDMDALENEMYAGNISKEIMLELDSCRNETEVVAIKCSVAK